MRNHQPTRMLTNTTPFEQRFGTKPDVAGSHRFGCTAYIYNTATQHKLDPRAKQAIFVGYADTQKAWRFYLPEKRTIQVSAHAKFVDDSDSRDSFLAEGEYQFSYDSL